MTKMSLKRALSHLNGITKSLDQYL